MATGRADQHQSYVRNDNDGSFRKGRNQMSSQQNEQCAYNESIHAPHHTDSALPKHPDIFAPGQHAELRISRAPLSQMESYPYYLENFRDPNDAFREVKATQQEMSPGRGADDVVPLTSIQKQLTRYGCYSIPSSRTIMAYPAGQCLPTLYEDILHVQNNVYSSCLYPKAEEPSEKNNAFPCCLYPKHVKIKLNVSPPEKPPEPMESREIVKHIDRNVRVSLMASAVSPEQISFKLLHDEPVPEPEPEPENIAMPLEIMPSPPPPNEVAEVKLLPVEDSYKAHAKKYFRSCLGVSSVVTRALGIGTYVGLAMAHQFAVYSVKVLKNGLHVYGPVVAKATVSSYKGLQKGGKVFLHKSAPIANHAKNVTLAHIRRTRERCVREMMKQCLACFPSDIDAEYELESFDEIHQPGSNRPSHHDNERAWKESLRLYPEPPPEPQEDSEPKSDSEVSCSEEECMAGNLEDKPTTEVSVLEDSSYYSHKKDCTSQHDKKRPSRLSKRNSDKISSTVPSKGAGSGYSPDSLSRFRKRLSLLSVRNNQRENFRIQGLGALVWPPPDIRRFSDPIRGHQFIPNLAVRPGTKNYRDLIQEPPLEDEFIWRRTLRAYFPEKGADVRPEDVLLCRQAVPMKLLSTEEFERNKEDPMMPDRVGRLGLGDYPCYSDHLEAGELSYPSYSKKQPDYQHIKQPPLLQISHGDNIVHHCVPNRKSRTHELPNRGKDNKELGLPSLAHLKHDDFGSVGKSHFDDSEKLMRNEASSGISSIHFRMKEEDFWQANPIHSFESNWKSFRGSEAPHAHGKKRPHSPGSDLMEELPHSREAAGKSINSSRAHPHGKHQKLEVMSAPDPLIQAKFSKRPLRISKPKLSSDCSKFDSPAESRQSGRSLKTKPLDSRQSTPLKGRPPFHIPKISQTRRKVLVDRDGRSAHIPFSDKHSHSIPSSPVKSLDHPIPSDFRLRSPDLFPRGRKPLLINRRYYLRIHPQPSEKPYKSARRTPIINGDGGVSRTSSMRQASADDLKRKGRFFYKRPRSRAPFKSYAPDVNSKGKSKLSVFKNSLSFLRESLSSKILRQKSSREDDKPHPSAQSSFWNLHLEGKFQFFALKKSRPAPRPHSPRMPHGKIHDHSNVGKISHGKKLDQGLTPFQSQGSQKEPKRRPLYENIPRLKIFLSKKDPHGIRSLSQVKCRQHGTVLRINSSKKNPSSAGGDMRTKTNSKVHKILKKDVPRVSPRSCISFLYPIAPAKRMSVDRNVRGHLSSPKTRAGSGITPSSPGKMSKGPNTQGAKARSLSPSLSKRRGKWHSQKPMKSQHRCDNYAPIGSELTSIDGTNTSHIYEDQISDMDIERTSKPKPEDAASEKNYAENLSPAAVTLSTVRDTIESVNVDNADVKPASTTVDTSESAVLQPSKMMMNRGDEDGDDASSDTPYRLNPEISTLLTSYRQALIKEARKEPKSPSTGRLEIEREQDSATELHSKADAAQWSYQQSSNFDEPTFSPLSELFQDVNLQTLESTSKETLNFDIDSETSLLDSFKKVMEPHGEHTSDVDHTVEGEDDSIALEIYYEQKRGIDHPGEGEGALEVHHDRTLPAHLDKPEHRDEIQFYSSDEIVVSTTSHSFAESDKQNRSVNHPGEGGGEGDGALDNQHITLPAHLDKREPWDETHVYSPDIMNLSLTNESIANNGQQDRGVDPPLKGEGALEDHHRTLLAQIDEVEQRDEAYFYSPDGMNLSSTDQSFAESSHQNRDVDHPGEGDSALKNHNRTLPFHFDKDEHKDETHFYSPDGMNFSPTDHSFSDSSQQNRGVDHAGEGGTLDIHQPKLPAPSDEHELEDGTHSSSPVGMNSSPIDHSFADSGQLTIDGELFQTLNQLEPVYRQKNFGHLSEGYDQGEKSPASLAVDQTLAERQVDERLLSEDHHMVWEYTTIIRGVKESPLERQADGGHDQGEKSSAAPPIDQPFALPNETLELLDQTPPSNDLPDSRLFNVEIDTPEEIIFNSNEYEEPGHGTKDEGQMSTTSAHVDNRGKDKIEQIEEDIHLEYPNSRPPYLDQDDSKDSSSINMKIIKSDKLKNEKRKAWEVVSSAEEELGDAARRSLPPVKLDVEDDDNSKHKTRSELGNQSPSLVISEIKDLHYLSNPVKKDEPLHRQDLQIDPQEEPEDISSLPPRLLHDAMQIEKDQKYEKPVKPEHHDKLVVERDEADYRGIKERGEFSQSIESTYHQRPWLGEGEDDRQSSVSSESQRSNTERDTTPTSAMIDENFPKLKFSEKLVAWEMLARTYQPPAKYNGPSDDLATVVTVTSQHDQPSPESPQVRGLDLAKPSMEKASKRGHFDYENSIARPRRTKDTLELSREYAAEEESPLTKDDQSSRDVHNLAFDSTTTIRGEQESPLEHQTDEGHDNSSETSAPSLPIDQPLILPTEILQQSNQTAPPSIDISRSQLFDVEIDVVEESILDNDEYGEQGHETEDGGQMSMGTEHEDNEEKENFEVEGSSHLGSPSYRSTYSNQNDSENFSSSSEKLFQGMIIEGDRPRKEKRKAWEVVSSAEQELDDNARSLPPSDVEGDYNGGFESESDSDALEGKAENTLGSLTESEFLVSQQLSLSEVHETATEQGFATTSDSEEEVHRSRSFESLLLESGTSSPSDGNNFAPPARARRSVFKRPFLKESLIRISGNEQTSAALQQLQLKPESPAANEDSSPGGSSSQGSSDRTSTPPARSRGSVFIHPVLKKSLVQNKEIEQMFAELGSEKNSQIDQPSSTGIEDNSSSKQIENSREAEVRRSSSFDGLGGSSNGRGSGSVPKRRSLITRPVLKKSLEASNETEKAFSRLRSEQSDDELRFDVEYGERESGYQSDSLLDENRSESISSSPSTSQGSDENLIPPTGSRKRKSLLTRPFLKPSLVTTSETVELFSRLKVKQNMDTGNEEGFDTGPEGGFRRSSSFEGITRLDSSNSSQGLDRISIPARPRNSSLFTRPILKPSLVATLETKELFSRLQVKQNKDTGNEEGFDTGPEGGIRRSESFEGITKSDSSNSSQGLDRFLIPARPRNSSLFTRPILKPSLVSNTETERVFAQLQSQQNEIEERQSRREQRLGTREGEGEDIRRSSGFEGPTGLKDPIILDEMAVPRRGPRGSLLRSSVISTSENKEKDEAELSVSSAFKAGLESGASSQLLEGTSNFPPERSEESEGKTRWEDLSWGPVRLDQPRRSALKRSSVGTLDAEQSINEQTIRKSVNFDPSFIKDTSSDSEARSSASDASETFET